MADEPRRRAMAAASAALARPDAAREIAREVLAAAEQLTGARFHKGRAKAPPGHDLTVI